MSAFQHRCEHRCICMQDAHEAVFLSNGIFSLLLHKADPMHTVWKPLGAGFLSDCSHSLLLLPHLSKYLHVIQVYWFFFKQQTITDSVANIWMWFITRRVPKLIKRKKKQPHFSLLPLRDLTVTAGIPKFSLKIPVTASPLRKRGKTQSLQLGRHLIFCHFKWLLQLTALQTPAAKQLRPWLVTCSRLAITYCGCTARPAGTTGESQMFTINNTHLVSQWRNCAAVAAAVLWMYRLNRKVALIFK